MKILFLIALSSSLAFGHGSLEYPRSRVMRVWDGLSVSPRSPWVVQAVTKDGENSYYTWNQLSRNFPAAANEGPLTFNTYLANLPDGQLGSGGNLPALGQPNLLSYSGMDAVSNDWEWPTTAVSPGTITLRWNATAVHNPSFFKIWITKQTYNHRTALTWAQLEYLGQPTHSLTGNIYTMNVTLPVRTGHHVLYVAYQRVDPVGEVFFSTSDVDFGGGSSGPPVLSLSPAALEVAENATTASMLATLSAVAPAGGVTATYTTASGTAGGGDFTSTTGMLTFAAGETQKQISVPILDDTLQETDELFTVSLSNLNGAIAGQAAATVTIKDNDTPAPPLNSGYSFNIYQNWGTGWRAYLSVTNGSAAPWNPWTLEFDAPWTIVGGISNGILVSRTGNHYTISPASWNTNIPVGNDLQLEFGTDTSDTNDTTPPTNLRINGQLVAGMVPGVSIAPLSVSEGSSAGTAVLTVSLESAHTAAIYVSYATANGTALAGTDYTAASGSLTFTPGQTTKTISVPFVGDTVDNPDKTFTVALAGVPGQPAPRFVSGRQSATVTLLDDDSPVTGSGNSLVLVGDVLLEGNSGSKNAVFTFKLATAAAGVVSVDYASSNLTATAGTDYTATSGTLTFAAGATTSTVNVPVSGDATDETLEMFQLNLSNPVGCNPLNSSAVCQIVDDELAPNAYGTQRIVAYIDGTSGTSNLPPANRVTHIMVAFASIDANGALIFPIAIDIPAITALKTQNPALKVLLSVGGWEWSQPFTSVANNEAKRIAFANSCKQKCLDLNLDGIDIDWEWPGGGNTAPLANDRNNFTALVHGVRLALDSLTPSTGKAYELTCYAPADATSLGFWDLALLKNDFNFFNVQGYDLHGTWENKTGHQSGLHRNPLGPNDGLNQEQVLALYAAAGVPKNQLLVGAPFYGQAWTATNFAQNGLFQNANPFGTMTYATIATGPAKNYLRTWDNAAKVPWLFDALGTKRVVSYDDPQAVFEKATYSRTNGYSGVYFWQLGGDSVDRQLLITLSDTFAAPAITNADTDSDEIPDAWEQQHFGNLTTTTATSDYDGDGASDFLEYHSRTDPKDRTSRLRIGLHDAGTTEPMVGFDSVSGVNYTIERSFDLTTWTVLGTIPGTGGHLHYHDDSVDGADRAFYRVLPSH
ncbi:MAG: lytic polysaccharide monooxygenase [Akkermansiaceae bacterium]|nr:lytic polysaccharide monooxygenase [Akkermansiaceae bacterium]